MVEMGMDKMFTSGRLVVTKINNGSLTNKQNIHMKKYLNTPSFIKKVIPATLSLLLGTLSVSAQLPNSGDSFLNVPYKTVSGQTLRLDIYTPNSSGPTPVVVYTHGGGWSSGNKNHIEIGRQRSVALELLEAGIAVVTVQYRLATTASGSTIRNCIIDAKDACRFLSKNANQYNIDERQMATFGNSAGGHIAMMLAITANAHTAYSGSSSLSSHNDYRIRGCVNWYGPSSFREEEEVFWTSGGRFLGSFNQRIFGNNIQSASAQNLERKLVSPIFFLQSISPSIFSYHGTEDATIPIRHSTGMRDRATQVGNSNFGLQIVQNAGHGFLTGITPSADEIIADTTERLAGYVGVDPSANDGAVRRLRKSNSTGFAIDAGNGGSNGQNVKLGVYNFSNINQQWNEIDRGGGNYTYQKRNTNAAIDGGGGGSNGQNVRLFNMNPANQNQHWRRISAGSNRFRLLKRNSQGFSIDGGNGGANGQNVVLRPTSGSNKNQQWLFN